MPEEKLNRELCREYIREKLFTPKAETVPDPVGRVGIELETFPYFIDPITKETAPAYLFDPTHKLMKKLIGAAKPYGGVPTYRKYGNGPKGSLPQTDKIEFPSEDHFVFEPGGQVEIRTAPCRSATEAGRHLLSLQKILKEVTDNSGIHFGQSGLNPFPEVLNFGNQMDKPRYRAMERYFETIGPFGKKMMLQTCSLHINLDLGTDEPTQVKRFIAANLLSPFVTALFANSPHPLGENPDIKAYRSFIWQQTDPKRCGILPLNQALRSLQKSDLIDIYLEFALKAPLIYIPELGDQVFPDEMTMDHWLNNSIRGMQPTVSHFENHLSMLFPEVRPRSYMEIRTTDAPPVEWQMIPVYFYTGLLYNDVRLDAVLDLLAPLAPYIERGYKNAVFGFKSEEIFKIAVELVHLAIDGFSDLPEHFRNKNQIKEFRAFYERFPAHRLSFADL